MDNIKQKSSHQGPLNAAFLEDRLRARVPRLPVTYGLIAANLLVFAAMLLGGAGFWHSPNGVQLAWGANFGPATQDGEWWRLVTAMFLHFGVLHLGLNMWALWDGGQWVERMYGPLRFAVIYGLAGLLGNLLSLVTHGGQAVSGGASGAIFGVYGALLTYLWRERRRLRPTEFRWLFWGAVGFSLLTIVFGLLITGIDNAAHIGGLSTGLLLGWALMPVSAEDSAHRDWSKLLPLGFLLAAVLGLLSQLPEAHYRWRDEIKTRQEIGDFLRDDAAITADWEKLLREGKRGGLSFDELAAQIDHAVVERYTESFEELSALQGNSAIPSAATLDKLVRYAARRRDASKALVVGLREKNPKRIKEALDQAKHSGRE
jgi:rhomboid protease GluP